LEATELFQTFAEVGIGLAGFTGIVAALQSQDSRLPPEFLYLLGYSIGSVLFSLLPLLLLVSLTAEASWRISSGALFIAGAAVLVPYWIPGSTIRPKVLRWWDLWIAAIFGTLTLAMGCVALGLFSEHAAFVYAVGVFFILVMSFAVFTNLLLNRAASARKDPSDNSA
jgi:hypothetical protein